MLDNTLFLASYQIRRIYNLLNENVQLSQEINIVCMVYVKVDYQ